MTGAIDRGDLGIAEMREPSVLFGVRLPGPAFLAVDHQRRAADAAPQFLDLVLCHPIGRIGAHIIVELPAIGAVLVLIDAVLRQMTRLLGREMPVCFLHALEGILDRGVAPRQSARQRALLDDPFLHPLMDRHCRALFHLARRGAEAFDRDELLHGLGIDAGVADRDVAAERMRDDRRRRQTLLMDQLREIVDIGGGRIIAVGRPLAVAVTAQIGRQHMPIPAQGARDPIPIAAVVTPAMHQQQGRRGRVAPIHIMQPQPLREIDPRGGAGACQIGSGHRKA